jgi:hypothetical protein
MKLAFSQQNFEKISNIKFYENSFSGSRIVYADGQTEGQADRHDKAKSRFSQFLRTRLKRDVF